MMSAWMDTVLDSLFPPGAASVLSLSPGASPALLADELVYTRTFAPRRLGEFRHGRACARLALSRLGVAAVAIPVGSKREPVWPDGIVGSISHAGSAAAAVVARRADVRSLGLDLEAAGDLEAGLWSRICLPAEIARNAGSGYGAGCAARLVFSAKEAAYKALWPVTGRFLDFHDIEVRLDEAGRTFAVTSRAAHLPEELASAVSGRFATVGELFATAATLGS
jgi:4'-phosphopantetheinyl transferase EntD